MKPFTSIAIVVFLLVAVLQLLRVVLGWDVTIGGVLVPSWASVIVCLAAATLAFKVWREEGA
jgi:hypothetical protein